KEVRDLVISAMNGWCLAFDNLTQIHGEMSDALCTLSTGGGFSTRALYTDAEEKLFQVQRPAILGGIGDLVTKGDLLDRSLTLTLPVVEKRKRRRDEDVEADLGRALPGIYGALLDAVSYGMSNLGSVRLEEPPRLADFAYWVSACEPACGWPRGAFMLAYDENIRQSHTRALDGNLAEVIRLLASRGWAGTASAAVNELLRVGKEDLQNTTALPRDPATLGKMLARLSPNLRAEGIEVLRQRTGKQRVLTFKMVEEPVTAVTAVRR
ncbi:MAG TPA: hypothetical protein VMZ90_10545, partial [Vicinamibacterales bacterium]|nr:hypothetical protein [Vicinamibacterales bacterium]